MRCATMQSAPLRYLSSKYYYCILSMMMMLKEPMVCFIVFFYNKLYGLVKKSNLYLNYGESYDNFIDFMAAILNFSFLKDPLRMTALHRPRYYYGVLSMHNQKTNKLVSAKTRQLPWLPDHIDFTDTNTKKRTLHPSILGVCDRETSFAPEYTRRPRFKG